MNDELLAAYRESLKAGEMTSVFINLLVKLVKQNIDKRYSHHFKVHDYDFLVGMEEHAIKMAMKNWNDLNLEKSTNAQAFFTTKIAGAMCRYLSDMRKKSALESSVSI